MRIKNTTSTKNNFSLWYQGCTSWLWSFPGFKGSVSKKTEIYSYKKGLAKWKLSTCVPFQMLLLSPMVQLTLLHMENLKLQYPQTKKRICQFQFGYILIPNLNTRITFNYQVKKAVSASFSAEIIKSIRISYD